MKILKRVYKITREINLEIKPQEDTLELKRDLLFV